MCQKPRHGASATDEAQVPLLSRSQYVEQFQQMGQSEVPRRTEVFFLHFFSLSRSLSLCFSLSSLLISLLSSFLRKLYISHSHYGRCTALVQCLLGSIFKYIHTPTPSIHLHKKSQLGHTHILQVHFLLFVLIN